MTGDDQERLPGAGWYPDAATPERERLWTGERWLDWIRPARADRVESTPAGWHPDQTHPGFERLWSGEMWTEEIRRAAPEVISTPATVGAPAGGPPRAVPTPGAPRLKQAVTYHDERPPVRLGGLAGWVGIAFLAVVLAAIAELVADQIYIGVENDVLDGGFPSPGHVDSAVSAVHTTHTILLVVYLITAVLFIAWFYRAYRNLVRTGVRDLRFGPGWAIGGWFIPFFNLVRQKQIANDIWKASASAGTVGLERRREIALPGVLNWWWGTWIFGGILVAIGNRAVRRANQPLVQTLDSLHDERTGLWFVQVGLVVLIVAAVLAYLFVRDVSRMQDEHFEATVPGTGAGPGHPWAAVETEAQPVVPVSAGSTRTCPDCAEQVKAEALVCRYCGHRFGAPA